MVVNMDLAIEIAGSASVAGKKLDSLTDAPLRGISQNEMLLAQKEGHDHVRVSLDPRQSKLSSRTLNSDIEHSLAGTGADDAGKHRESHFKVACYLVVSPVHSGVGAGLEFVDSVKNSSAVIRRSRPAADHWDGNAAGLDQAPCLHREAHGFTRARGTHTAVIGCFPWRVTVRLEDSLALIPVKGSPLRSLDTAGWLLYFKNL